MARKRTYKLTDLTIGSKVFVVHRNYAFAKRIGGKVMPARVVSFINSGGTVIPEFKLAGHPTVVNENTHVPFTDIKLAISAIKS